MNIDLGHIPHSRFDTLAGEARAGDHRGYLSETWARAERALALDAPTSFDGPPPEVQREMAEAERAYEDLAAQGREVRFATGADGRVSIELTDAAGHAIGVIGPVGFFRLLKLAL